MNIRSKWLAGSLSVLFIFFWTHPVRAQNDHALRSLVKLEPAFPNLKFDQPVDFQYAPDGSGRLFVVEQRGVIRVFTNSPDVKTTGIFLDLRQEVRIGHSEEGLLGLAFHPAFKDNGYFFVDYIADKSRRTVVARFRIDQNNPDQADPFSKTVILEAGQPYGNHNGGQLAFGPDGFLYIALGDGGAAGDPHGNGQNRQTLLGSILRIDVDHEDQNKRYAIPADNPFANNDKGYQPEIFAYGLRNPWRFSFDPATGLLWAGDVGQDKPYEEIDIIKKGKNYGWNIMEGTHCFQPPVGCHQGGLELPVWEYSVDQGRCIIGGRMYRGQNIPELVGHYVYGDYVSGRIWALKLTETGQVMDEEIDHNSNLYPTSFGVDEKGEMVVCSFDGNIYGFKRIP